MPFMFSSKSKKKLSSNRLFYFFIFISLVISILISMILVGGNAERTLLDVQEKTSKTESQLTINNLSQFLNTRVKLLQDLARQPLLANSVMGSSQSLANLIDFFQDYKFLGKKESIKVLNIIGDVVYSNTGEKHNLATYPWFNEIIEGKSSAVITARNQENQSYPIVVVPVLYNELVEGVLIVEFSTSLNVLLHSVVNDRRHGIELAGKYLAFSTLLDKSAYTPISDGLIPTTNLQLEYFIRTDSLDTSIKKFMQGIALAIVLSLILSFIVLAFFGRHLLLNPFQQLQKAKEENDWLVEALEKNPVGVSIADAKKPDMPLVYVNGSFSEITGYSEADVIGTNCRFLQGAQTAPEAVQALSQAIKEQRKQRVEFINYKKDGTPFWNDLEISPIFDNENNLVSYVGVQQDITERIENAQYLKESREQLELIIDATSVGIWDWQVQSGELVINERWAEIVGYQLEELTPVTIDTWISLVHPDELETSGKLLQQHWHGETEHYVLEARMKHKNGHWVWVLDTGKVVEWHSDGSPKRMIGTHLDITKRKQYETELQSAKETAEQANQAKSQFLASMSHEIRTPMNGVIGMLGLLKNTPLTDDQRHRVQLAEGSAHSLLNLINDILDFSKVDAGKLELEFIDFDLVSMISDFAQSTAQQAQEKGLELILDTSGIDASMVKGDPGRLRQIITNIVGNAIKFTSEGEILIRSRLQELDADTWRFECSIADTGIGIPADKIDGLFESFSQVDTSTTRQYGGTGLGLSIVKKLCQLMQGDIQVNSELNQGSCFAFHVTLQKSSASKVIMPKVDMQKLHLLIVDNNTTNRQVLKEQLEYWGANVEAVAYADEALTVCEYRVNDKQTPFFDAAFLDMQMPDMDGAELGKQLANDERFNTMKLVVMTSMGYQGEAQFLAEHGISAYFPKPATVSDLIDALNIVVDDGPAMAQARPLVTQHYIRSLKRSNEIAEDDDPPWFKDKRLLLVEDNRVNQLVATGILKNQGITQIDVAENGVEALEKLNTVSEDSPYHLILMDCQMPEMDGYETSRQIRSGQAGETNQSISIIAMTANAMEGDKEKCMDAGMNDYLSKPIDRDLMIVKLKQWLA